MENSHRNGGGIGFSDTLSKFGAIGDGLDFQHRNKIDIYLMVLDEILPVVPTLLSFVNCEDSELHSSGMVAACSGS